MPLRTRKLVSKHGGNNRMTKIESEGSCCLNRQITRVLTCDLIRRVATSISKDDCTNFQIVNCFCGRRDTGFWLECMWKDWWLFDYGMLVVLMVCMFGRKHGARLTRASLYRFNHCTTLTRSESWWKCVFKYCDANPPPLRRHQYVRKRSCRAE